MSSLKVDYVSEVLPALLVFALGLSMTVAPLTAAVLAGAGKEQAGIASGVNNAIARVAGLLGTAALGAIVAASFASTLREPPGGHDARSRGACSCSTQAKRLPLGRPDVHGLPPAQARALTAAAEQASLHSFHLGMAIAAVLVAVGGRGGSGGDPQPRQTVHAASCAAGQLVGASSELAQPTARRCARGSADGLARVGAHRLDDRAEPASAWR